MDLFIALLLLSSSSFDVGSDSYLANSYLEGTYYTKYVENQSDPAVQSGTYVLFAGWLTMVNLLMSEALIFASTNPQYDNRLFIELPVQYMKSPS